MGVNGQQCAWCRGPIPLRKPGKRGRVRFCSVVCGSTWHSNHRPKSKDWAQGRQPERRILCCRCGVEIITRASRQACGPCKVAALRERDARPRPARGRKARLRRAVAERDGWVCWMCGRGLVEAHPDPRRRLTADHLVPQIHGGSDEPENLRAACQSCNSRRGARPIEAVA